MAFYLEILMPRFVEIAISGILAMVNLVWEDIVVMITDGCKFSSITI
jgi:hypothetical protein